MKIVILGANGMLGSALSSVFRDLEPVELDKADIDIADAKLLHEKLQELLPDVMINAAAYTDVDGAETNAGKEMAMRVNADGVKNLAAVAKDINAKLVHYSTDYVFSNGDEAGFDESAVPGPALNAYGESKLKGEEYLAASGTDHYLIRTAWLYGSGGKNFVDTMLKLGSELDSLRVVDDQHGSPTFTQDLAKFTRELLEGGYELGVYHGVNAGVTTWAEFAKKIFELTKLDVEVEPVPSSEYPRPAKRPEWGFLKNTKGPAMRSWEVAVEDYLSQR